MAITIRSKVTCNQSLQILNCMEDITYIMIQVSRCLGAFLLIKLTLMTTNNSKSTIGPVFLVLLKNLILQ